MISIVVLIEETPHGIMCKADAEPVGHVTFREMAWSEAFKNQYAKWLKEQGGIQQGRPSDN